MDPKLCCVFYKFIHFIAKWFRDGAIGYSGGSRGFLLVLKNYPFSN